MDFLKKWNLLGITCALTSLSTMTYAGGRVGQDPKNISQQLDALNSKVDDITVTNIHGTLGAKNPSHLSFGNLFLTGDFLWWKATEDGLEYANLFQLDFPNNNIDAHVRAQDLHFGWDPGFRLGIGYMFEDWDQWDLYLNWTSFHTEASGSEGTPVPTSGVLSGSFLTPRFVNSSIGQAYWASGHWHLRFDTLDLELGRNFFVGKALSLRPHIGLRGAFIRQQYSTHYKMFSIQSDQGQDSVFFPPSMSMRAKNNYYAGGVRAGLEFQWHASDEWNFLGQFSGTVVYGKFDVDQDIDFGIINVDDEGRTITTTTGEFDFDDTLWRNRANLEGGLGVQWEHFFYPDKYHLALTLMYELGKWFDQNELRQFLVIPQNKNILMQDTRDHGNLGMQGITVKARLDF